MKFYLSSYLSHFSLHAITDQCWPMVKVQAGSSRHLAAKLAASSHPPDGIQRWGSNGISGKGDFCHLSQSYPELHWDKMSTGSGHPAPINVNHKII